MQNGKYVPLGYQQISATALGNATGLTPPGTATVALISVETAPIRWRDDGMAPSSSTGTVITSGGSLEYWGDLGAIELIAQSGSPTVDVSYYRFEG